MKLWKTVSNPVRQDSLKPCQTVSNPIRSSVVSQNLSDSLKPYQVICSVSNTVSLKPIRSSVVSQALLDSLKPCQTGQTQTLSGHLWCLKPCQTVLNPVRSSVMLQTLSGHLWCLKPCQTVLNHVRSSVMFQTLSGHLRCLKPCQTVLTHLKSSVVSQTLPGNLKPYQVICGVSNPVRQSQTLSGHLLWPASRRYWWLAFPLDSLEQCTYMNAVLTTVSEQSWLYSILRACISVFCVCSTILLCHVRCLKHTVWICAIQTFYWLIDFRITGLLVLISIWWSCTMKVPVPWLISALQGC